MANDGIVIKKQTHYFNVARDVWGLRDMIVNIFMIRNAQDGSWVLVDAGLKTSASKIRKMAAQLFGEFKRPSAIVLTHGHFDHVGSLKALAEEWDVPIYAHRMELPYLTGESSYPPPDASVGGGMMAFMAPLYPKKPIDVSERLEALPDDGSIPVLEGWRYIYTPGHTPGHISLFRSDDRILIAGDAFVTTKQESAIAVMMQTESLNGPPAYFTCDWEAAQRSVAKLETLQPEVVATGHGRPMRGARMRDKLRELALNFREQAVPSSGRYVKRAAEADEHGVTYVPPRNVNYVAIGLGAAAIVAAGVYVAMSRKQHRKGAPARKALGTVKSYGDKLVHHPFIERMTRLVTDKVRTFTA